jgi:arginine deiminase
VTLSRFHGVDSELGRLGTVLLHRPGMELRRITPRHKGKLLFDTIPWVGRAQQEHDVLAAALRQRGAEVSYLTELLQDCLEYQPARSEAIASVLADGVLGDELRGYLRAYLSDLDPERLAQVLIAGLLPEELRLGRGVVYQLLQPCDFVIDPLPNLLFVRDSSVWIGDQVAVTSPAAARRREASLLHLIYAHHPRFAGTKQLYHPGLEPLEGGDVLLLGPGAVAIGTGIHSAPAGVERLARRVFDAGLAHTVLAVPLARGRRPAHLDTVCTIIDADAVVMSPADAYTLTAHVITMRAEGPGVLRVSRAQPFLEAAAQAMGIERLKVIDTGVDPVISDHGQWDDGNNILAIAPRVVVAYERNCATNATLEAAGVEVIRIPGSELAGGRGGPRCMSCPVSRDPAAAAPVCPDPAGTAAPASA